MCRKSIQLISFILLLVGLAGVTNAAVIGFQAESGDLGADFDPPLIDPNELALGGQYITIETPAAGGSPGHEDRIATYTVTFPEAGAYNLYIRLMVEDLLNEEEQGMADNDSMFYGNGFGTKPPASNDDWIQCNGFDQNLSADEWLWVNLSENTGAWGEGGVTFEVPAGELTQTLQVGAREDGLRMDAFVFSTTTLIDPQLDAAVPQETKAFGAEPADGSLVSETSVVLSWEPGIFATEHHVYFSANINEVSDRAAQADKGLTTAPTYSVSELVPGTVYYWAVDEVSATDIWPGEVWSFTILSENASNPDPYDGEISIDPDVVLAWSPGIYAVSHKVYLDAARENVEARSGCLVNGVDSNEANYSPGPLDSDTTYYWAIDEVGDAPDNTTYTGEVWSFTTMPDIPIHDPNLVGWWTFDEGAGTTALDWSGHGNHGVIHGNPAWVAGYSNNGYALDFDGLGDYVDCGTAAIFDITEQITITAWMRVDLFEQTDQGIASKGEGAWQLVRNGTTGNELRFDCNDVGEAIGSTNVNDGQWHHVAGIYDGSYISLYVDGALDAYETGSGSLATNDITVFIGDTNRPGSGPQAWNGIIDDVRIYNRALAPEEIELTMRGNTLIAWNPNPGNDSTLTVEQLVPLSWSPGDNAAEHDVYFGTDADAVGDADTSTADVYRGRQAATSYNPPEGFDWGQDYYWRIDEVQANGTVNEGNVWSFWIADYLTVEDFEDYNDFEPDTVWNTWSDGYGIPTNGSTAGYPDPDFVAGEHYLEYLGVVLDGQWSMPLYYDNSAAPISEVTRTFASTERDWTREGVGVLTLFYHGDPENAAEQMFIVVDGVVVVNDDASAALVTDWTPWNIPLQSLADQGVNLNSVRSMTIGFGNKANLVAGGGSGHVFFDGIRLYQPSEEAN